MKFKQWKVAWMLFRVAFKVRMMGLAERKLYIAIYRLHVDLRSDMTAEQKETIHKFLDKVVDK